MRDLGVKPRDQSQEKTMLEVVASKPIKAAPPPLTQESGPREYFSKLDLLHYFGSVPEDTTDEIFNRHVRRLTNRRDVEQADLEVLSRAIAENPTRIYPNELCPLVASMRLTSLAEFYIGRANSQSGSRERICANDPRVLVVLCGLYAHQALCNIASGDEVVRARDALRQFCNSALAKFPNLPDAIHRFLHGVHQKGRVVGMPSQVAISA